MQISEHHVRECAYYIWENEGRVHGQAAAHWLRAESELRADAVPAAGASVTEAAPAAKVTKVPAKAAAPKAAPAKAAAPKTAAPKAAAKPAAPVKAAAKPSAPKPVRASKVAVTAGLTAKAKPARAPASMH